TKSTVDGEPGAYESPSCPRSTVVTPCRSRACWTVGSNTADSAWQCVSTNPGSRYRPVASIVAAASAPARAPTAAIRPSRTPGSGCRPAPPRRGSRDRTPDEVMRSGGPGATTPLHRAESAFPQPAPERVQLVRRHPVPAEVPRHVAVPLVDVRQRAEHGLRP